MSDTRDPSVTRKKDCFSSYASAELPLARWVDTLMEAEAGPLSAGIERGMRNIAITPRCAIHAPTARNQCPSPTPAPFFPVCRRLRQLVIPTLTQEVKGEHKPGR